MLLAAVLIRINQQLKLVIIRLTRITLQGTKRLRENQSVIKIETIYQIVDLTQVVNTTYSIIRRITFCRVIDINKQNQYVFTPNQNMFSELTKYKLQLARLFLQRLIPKNKILRILSVDFADYLTFWLYVGTGHRR